MKQRLNAFRFGTDGSVTVEYVLWLPVMFLLTMLTTDATMLMHEQTNLMAAARDASREVATGKVSTTQAEERLLARLGNGRNYKASVSASGHYVTSTVSVPFSDVVFFGGTFTKGNLAGQATMYVEGSN